MTKYLFLLFFLIFIQTAYAVPTYMIQESDEDRIFIINGVKFTAQDYCLDVKAGDRVYFTGIGQRQPFNGCAEAEFIVLRTQAMCNVWC